MKKSEAMDHWRQLPEDVDPLEHMVPIRYKAKGSRYGACGIRIDGTPEFIDAVLGRLKGLIDGENNITRLELARNVVDGSSLGKVMPNKVKDAECCYIRLHERGNQGKIASVVFDKDLHSATEKFVDLKTGKRKKADGRTDE